MKVTYDNTDIDILDESTAFDLIKGHDGSVPGSTVAVTVNDVLVDLHSTLHEGDKVGVPVSSETPEGLSVIRHSTAHVLAEAVKSLYPEAKVTIGPTIEAGFYYDFDVDSPFTPEDLEAIEKRMKEIIKGKARITRKVVSRKSVV